ncbi:hypothetical protein OGAPHI_005848 [Ogataea philodendri]|uniref:histidine kinase n=1 Tax=Ogataea philodendri TaxID=1378263 RepID=A0A9P8T1J4_9ASCO|nr:uncharacterized protein OGAPHI_005848 [Ogataea philodendri]KAH3662596.1 hypothetical protein OGAPHI_005848 [Ogataea philodendri]
MRWHRIRISIRTQLIALVLFVALFSLFVLAVVTGVYFTSVFTSARVDKLQVVAELKAAQIQQSFIYYYYQIYFLSTRDTLENALSSRKVGNNSNSVSEEAIETMKQSLDASASFNDARLYDLNLELIASVANKDASANCSQDLLDKLYVLSYKNVSSITNQLVEQGGYVSGPRSENGQYFMSLSLPVYSNNSVLLATPNLSGYLSVVVNVDSLESVGTNVSTNDYSAIYCMKSVNSHTNMSESIGFKYMFKNDSETYNLSDYAPAQDVFRDDQDQGHYTDLRNPFGERVSVGYATAGLAFVDWVISVEQSRGKFMEPTVKLTKLIVGVCIGIAAFMCCVTFPLAHYGVRPILKLQKATEQVAEGRGLRHVRRRKKSSALFHTDRKDKDDHDGPASGASYKNRLHLLANNLRLKSKREAGESTHVKTESSDTSEEKPYSPVEEIQRDSRRTAHESFDSHVRPRTGGDTMLSPHSNDTFPDWIADRTPPTPAIVQGKGLFYDELSELTEAFNVMTEELDLQYTHLEDRVRARTKELEVAKVQADAARQQAEDANEAKTVFIANISHELRTPLNGILGMTSVAMAEQDTQKIQSSLELIFRSGELLLHILTQLLTFSKNQLQKSKLQKRTFQVYEIASQAQSIFGKSAKDQNVNLKILTRPDFLRRQVFYSDSNRLIQVMMNLVSNSLKFTPEKGTITLLMRILGEYDEARSRDANFETVYVKGNPTYSSADISESDTKSVHTVASSNYRVALADSYNHGTELRASVESLVSGVESDVLAEFAKNNSKYMAISKPVKWVFELSITDTGSGIDKSLQDKIFDAFVQGDQTLSRSYGGTGLGLSICKQFAKMMHGTLTLKSEVGKGSKFTFTIPLPQVGEFEPEEDKIKKVSFADEEAFKSTNENEISYFQKPDLITRASTGTAHSNRKSSTSSGTSSNSSGVASTGSCSLRFLIAEDNLVNQEVIKRMLRLEGITDTTLACDGSEAILLMKEAQANNETYDLVFMDVQMPNIDGLSATRVIRDELKYTGPIVALTAFADQSNKEDCLNAGMSGFLSKPIGRGLLRRILHEFCPSLSPRPGAEEFGEAAGTFKKPSRHNTIDE